MVQGTPNEKLELLKQELQHARTEQETHRALQKAEIDAEKQARDEAARRRHEDMMNQLRAMRELLHEQRASQAQQVEQMEQRHAEEAQRDEGTLKQMSDLQNAVTFLHEEQGARSEQHAEERARAKADTEAVKKMTEAVAETRDELLSIADELREESTRRHEELRHILLANASARESVSFSEP
ncbi:hypothetical protein BGY98DRAFT_973754 [Russula aff. rugulosa BPL654]|nr:hypothetical protein BGY98DRAFT_973754 [Russula aff. rugulosa BPL654]